MLVFLSDHKLYFTLVINGNTAIPTIIYEGEFGDPDEFRAYTYSYSYAGPFYCVIMMIGKNFYAKHLYENIKNEWMIIEGINEDLPIDFIRTTGNVLLAIYPDATMMKVDLGSENIPHQPFLKREVYDSIPRQWNVTYKTYDGLEIELLDNIHHVYHDHVHNHMIIRTPDNLGYYVIKINTISISMLINVCSKSCDKDDIDFLSNSEGSTTLSSEGIMKVYGEYRSSDIHKISEYLGMICSLNYNKELEVWINNDEKITIVTNVSNFHTFQNLIYTIEDNNLIMYTAEKTNIYKIEKREIIFTANDIHLPITSSYDVGVKNTKSARHNY